MLKNQNKFLLNKRLEILKFFKKTINKKGLSFDTIKILSNDYNINENEIHLLFPQGNSDIIKFTLDQLNNDLENYCKKLNLITLPLHKRIKKILLCKIFLMNKEKDFYRKIFLNILLPKKNFSISSQLYKSVNKIWIIAGDTSTDFNYYTKRLILAGIYTRVILFFFNNNDQEKLEEIIDINLKRVAKIPELKLKMKLFKKNFPNILKIIKNFN
mgnify:CR=1 FL=1